MNAGDWLALSVCIIGGMALGAALAWMIWGPHP